MDVADGRKSNASPVRISRVLSNAEIDVPVPYPVLKSSFMEVLSRSRMFTPSGSDVIGVLMLLASGGVVNVLNGLASLLRGMTKYKARVSSRSADILKSPVKPPVGFHTILQRPE